MLYYIGTLVLMNRDFLKILLFDLCQKYFSADYVHDVAEFATLYSVGALYKLKPNAGHYSPTWNHRKSRTVVTRNKIENSPYE